MLHMRIQEYYPLNDLNTLGFDVVARYFVSIETTQELKQSLAYARQKNLPVLPLGGGSNVVLSADFDGLVIHIQSRGIEVREGGDGNVLVAAQAGENWHHLVCWTLEHRCHGLENLSLIPGSVGAAPIQNIGAYGVELKDCFHSLQAMHRTTLESRVFDPDECRFAYRDSVFKHQLKDQYIITEVSLCLSREPNIKIDYPALMSRFNTESDITPRQVSDMVCAIRSAKLPDPQKTGNVGSFFKNPVVSARMAANLKSQFPGIPMYPVAEAGYRVAAGWLIEHCGFKGRQWGAVGVHAQQALVLVNLGTGTGKELLDLATCIQQAVASQFGIQLDIEPRVYASSE